MILGDDNRATDRDGAANGPTLDDLFRRAGVRHADAMALIDAPNRASFADGAPQSLTYAQADRAISMLAAQLRRLGLQTDAVVAIQLANTVESVIALLGVLRARLIAAPLPLLWRREDIAAALSRIGARAMVTASRIGAGAQSTPLAEIAMQAAADVFAIRHVCAFGRDLPDGVVPLDACLASDQQDFVPPPARPGNAAAHVAVVTFDCRGDGLVAVARNHIELIAGGLGPYLESGAGLDASLLSTIPLGSFAGIALGLVPWLIGGGTLSLHHAFNPDAFAAQCRDQDGGCVVVPGPALGALAAAGHFGGAANSVVALWRSPGRLAGAAPWRGEPSLVDVASFGEIGLIASPRGVDGMPAAIPFGIVGAPRGSAAAVTVIETMRSVADRLALRGPMVPAHAFPPGAEHGREPCFTAHDSGFVDTGFACRLERDSAALGTLAITAPPVGIANIGGYRFRQAQLDREVAEADRGAVIVALPDAFLDQRLAGSAPDAAATAQALAARGVNPLIAGAFRGRNGSKAA